MGYIVPVDAPNPDIDKAGFLSKAVDMQQFEVYARRIESKHALFIFDSCFSGSIFGLERAIPQHISYKTARPVRQFITSGSAGETVPDKSIFRHQFLEAVDGEADVNEDNYITGSELGEFLFEKVVNYSRGTQHPQYGKIRHMYLKKATEKDNKFAMAYWTLSKILFDSGKIDESVKWAQKAKVIDPDHPKWPYDEDKKRGEPVYDLIRAIKETPIKKISDGLHYKLVLAEDNQ